MGHRRLEGLENFLEEEVLPQNGHLKDRSLPFPFSCVGVGHVQSTPVEVREHPSGVASVVSSPFEQSCWVWGK